MAHQGKNIPALAVVALRLGRLGGDIANHSAFVSVVPSGPVAGGGELFYRPSGVCGEREGYGKPQAKDEGENRPFALPLAVRLLVRLFIGGAVRHFWRGISGVFKEGVHWR